MTSIINRVTPLIHNAASKLHLSLIFNAVFGILSCIMLVIALSYNYFSKESDPAIKDKYFKGIIVTALVFASFAALLGLWLIYISKDLKKQCSAAS